MRFNNYLNNSYIGIVNKKEKNRQEPKKDRKTNNLLKELNDYLFLHTKYKDLKFDIVNNYSSPSEIIQDIDEQKLEKLTRKWMKISEKFEEIKESHIDKIKKI